jgi:hypothetical protein
LIALGWQLVPANDARVAGLNNMRRYTHIDPTSIRTRSRGSCGWTRRATRACLAQVARIQLDPDKPEDALKVDADSAGRGGDDMYDETRYGLMSRPIAARVIKEPPYKEAHKAHAIKVEDGKLVKPAPEPKTMEELVQWANRHKTQTRVPSFTQRVPRKR